MAVLQTQIAAVSCAWIMERHGFVPATIVNVGVGSSPEASVWRRMWPDVPVIGADPRRRPGWWVGQYRQCAVGRSDRGMYCQRCRSASCSVPEHQKHIVEMMTMKTLIAGAADPLFVWMDIEGGELDALKSCGRDLSRVRWLNVEVRNFDWDDRCADKLLEFLAANRFRRVWNHSSEDVLFRKR